MLIHLLTDVRASRFIYNETKASTIAVPTISPRTMAGNVPKTQRQWVIENSGPSAKMSIVEVGVPSVGAEDVLIKSTEAGERVLTVQ